MLNRTSKLLNGFFDEVNSNSSASLHLQDRMLGMLQDFMHLKSRNPGVRIDKKDHIYEYLKRGSIPGLEDMVFVQGLPLKIGDYVIWDARRETPDNERFCLVGDDFQAMVREALDYHIDEQRLDAGLKVRQRKPQH